MKISTNLAAMNFRPGPAVFSIDVSRHRIVVERFEERRPSGSTVIFMLRTEQRRITNDAVVKSISFVRVKFTWKWLNEKCQNDFLQRKDEKPLRFRQVESLCRRAAKVSLYFCTKKLSKKRILFCFSVFVKFYASEKSEWRWISLFLLDVRWLEVHDRRHKPNFAQNRRFCPWSNERCVGWFSPTDILIWTEFEKNRFHFEFCRVEFSFWRSIDFGSRALSRVRQRENICDRLRWIDSNNELRREECRASNVCSNRTNFH